ncbi:glycosyltransferase family 2 protein [Flavobacterium sp. MK4S-17]|uniref:glycosyltransferase family 2 protein n=1 Tax=Flavobacterium sp. MK4S-17 TaxID=2543737 RepID=UPI001356A1D7|nr:glycosyltransferase family 2 protein [Flavobacterium sp. MK4S-17]
MPHLLYKEVYIIIVTYNGSIWIDKNIQSLLLSSYPVKIIVIDNNSTDDTLKLLKKYSTVDLIQLKKNFGFAKANNIGIRTALDKGADYIFLLNQDAWIFEDTILNLIEVMKMSSKNGIVSPFHYAATKSELDTSFKTYLSRSLIIDAQQKLYSTEFVNAAAWMLSRECIEKVGFFETMFGHYGEDRNYCDRVLYKGYTILITKEAEIVHDRQIIRSFSKDLIQSKYKILTTLINPNHNILHAYLLGLKEVFGLPKYFSKFYNIGKIVYMVGELLTYYGDFIIKSRQVVKARKRAL